MVFFEVAYSSLSQTMRGGWGDAGRVGGGKGAKMIFVLMCFKLEQMCKSITTVVTS